MTDKSKKIEELFNKGILINKELLEKELDDTLLEKIESESDLLVLNEDYTEIVKQQTTLVDWYEVDKFRVNNEKDRDEELYQSQLQSFRQSTLVLDNSKKQEISSLETELDEEGTSFSTDEEFSPEEPLSSSSLSKDQLTDSTVTIVISHKNIPEKYEIPHFTNIFLSRYRFLENILRPRRELKSTTSIGRLSSKKERESVAIIGIISDIGETKNGNLIITLEDPTGIIKTIVLKNKKELFLAAINLAFAPASDDSD